MTRLHCVAFAAAACLTLGLSACGSDKKDKDEGSSSLGNFDATAFDPSSGTTDLGAPEVAAEVSKSTALAKLFKNPRTAASTQAEPIDNGIKLADDGRYFVCDKERVNMDRITAAGSDLSWQGDVEFSACLSEMGAENPVAWVRSTTSFGCPGTDFGPLNGKSALDMSGLSGTAGSADINCGAQPVGSRAYRLSKTEAFGSMQYKAPDGSKGLMGSESRAIRTAQANMKDDGTACGVIRNNESDYSFEDCGYFVRRQEDVVGTEAASNSAKTVVVRTKTLGLKASAGQSFYSSGSIEIQINGWTGKVSFTDPKATYIYLTLEKGAVKKHFRLSRTSTKFYETSSVPK